MIKNIKISDEQLKKICESFDDEFNYLSDRNSVEFKGQKEITANGNMTDDEVSEPLTTDNMQQKITPQGYNRYGYFGTYPRSMREGVDINKDNVDDFYNNQELDILSNGDKKDNLIKIPAGIERTTNLLIDAVKNNKLSPKQQSIVLNKIIECFDLENIPFAWKKELMLKIKSSN